MNLNESSHSLDVTMREESSQENRILHCEEVCDKNCHRHKFNSRAEGPSRANARDNNMLYSINRIPCCEIIDDNSHRHTPSRAKSSSHANTCNQHSTSGSIGAMREKVSKSVDNESHRHTNEEEMSKSMRKQAKESEGNAQPTNEKETMDKNGTLVYNPYKERVQRTISYKKQPKRNQKATTPRKVLVDDALWFGNRMEEKKIGCRIFLQNPNGIDTSENTDEFRMKLDEMRQFKINMWLLPETNLNRSDYMMKEKLSVAVEAHCEQGVIEMTNTPGFPTDGKQPGGVATVLQGEMMSRYAGSEHDEVGRWVVSTFFGKNSQFKIYNVYRTVHHVKNKTGDSTAWSQQELYLEKHRKRSKNPREQIVVDLCKSIERDVEQANDILVCGDFNESLDEKKGLHKELNKLGLMNVLVGKIDSDLPRTYNGGSKCIEHVYAMPGVYDTIRRCGIAPFNYFQKSDHRGIYVDLDIERILETETNVIPAANLRRLKMTSVGSLKLYQEAIIKEVTKNKYVQKVDELQEIINNKAEGEKMIKIRLNELDEQITNSLRSAEKKCAKIHMMCRHDWSPELKFALLNLRHAKRHLKKTLRDTSFTEGEYIAEVQKAYDERRKWRKACREAKENSKELRESFLEDLSQHQALLNNTIASNEIKQLKRYEEQRKEARRIRSVLKGKNHRLLTSIEIPDISSYGEESKDVNFSHYNVNVIWSKLLKCNGTDVKTWERVDDRKLVEELILKWQQLYFGQSKDTPLASQELEERFK